MTWSNAKRCFPDGPPGESYVVLVRTKNEEFIAGFYDYKIGKWRDTYYENEIANVTHWIDLPEDYEVIKNSGGMESWGRGSFKKIEQKEEEIMHKKIMSKAAKALTKDAAHYAKEAKSAKSPVKKKHEKVERKEAMSAAKDLKKRVKKAHEY